jgi:hypothetical protein
VTGSKRPEAEHNGLCVSMTAIGYRPIPGRDQYYLINVGT